MSEQAKQDSGLNIERAFGQAFKLLLSHWGLALCVGLLASIPAIEFGRAFANTDLITLFEDFENHDPEILEQDMAYMSSQFRLAFGAAGANVNWIFILASMLASAFVSQSLTYSMVYTSAGAPVGFVRALQQGAAVFIQTVVLALLFNLALSLVWSVPLMIAIIGGSIGGGLGGLVALVFGVLVIFSPVGMLYLATRWLFINNTMVVERPGIFGAFSRSAEISKHDRWSTFAAMVIGFVTYLVASLVLGGILSASIPIDPAAVYQTDNLVFVALFWLLQSLIMGLCVGFWLGYLADLYVQLRDREHAQNKA